MTMRMMAGLMLILFVVGSLLVWQWNRRTAAKPEAAIATVDADASSPGPDGIPWNDAHWRKTLTAEQYRVCRLKGTERAFSGEYWDTKAEGTYCCVACGEALFNSKNKFDSGTGWPSFDRPTQAEAVAEHADDHLGYRRTEVICRRCGAHLGHVFSDGPQETTGLRYCINSVSLKFKP